MAIAAEIFWNVEEFDGLLDWQLVAVVKAWNVGKAESDYRSLHPASHFRVSRVRRTIFNGQLWVND